MSDEIREVTKKRRNTKPPARRLKSDSFQIEQDGETYYPHYGEWVEFGSSIRLDTMLAAMELQGLQDLQSRGVATAEDASSIRRAFLNVTDELAKAIKRWSWTNDEGKPYPAQPTKEDLRGLSMEELMWLVGAAFGSDGGSSEGEDSPS